MKKTQKNPGQGKRPDQLEKTMQIIEWLLLGVVLIGFMALMCKLGTLTWNLFKTLF